MLDDRDLEFIEVLRNLDVPRSVARLITCLAGMDERTSREIEMATGLKQPEVSIAMRTLRERSWVKERDINGKGKGRPTKIYSLGTTMGEIINYYEGEMNRESARTMETIQRLKELSSA